MHQIQLKFNLKLSHKKKSYQFNPCTELLIFADKIYQMINKMFRYPLTIAVIVLVIVSIPACHTASSTSQEEFKISLAQWSLQRTFIGDTITDWGPWVQTLLASPADVLKGADPMDFPEMAKGYGIECIELLNIFYIDKAEDQDYWKAFKQQCDDAGVTVGLIMCDVLGNLADADPGARLQAVENHYPWVDVARFLGAGSVRVNLAGFGNPDEVATYAIDGLTRLAEYASPRGINILVENQRGISADASWLSTILRKVNLDNVGALPDFGNFCIERGPDGCIEAYDRYKGIAELMPYAKGVSAKSYAFDSNGNEVESDFMRIMQIVKAAGFRGYVGIEYDGTQLSEDEGIKATKRLLEKVFRRL